MNVPEGNFQGLATMGLGTNFITEVIGAFSHSGHKYIAIIFPVHVSTYKPQQDCIQIELGTSVSTAG